MKVDRLMAPWAAMAVVLSGSVAFVYSAFVGVHEIATASAAFAGVGLYLLFGKNPPPS